MLAILVIPLLVTSTMPSHAQEYSDTHPTLVAVLETSSQYVFKDEQGYAFLAGMVKNTSPFGTISDLQIRVSFYDDLQAAPRDVVHGSTALEAIPPNSKSPFLIRSTGPDMQITQASASIMTFDTSADKEQQISINIDGIATEFTSTATDNKNSFTIQGSLSNGPAPSSNATIHLAFYDVFEPPRILDVRSIQMGDLAADSNTPFFFKGEVNSAARGAFVFAESDVLSALMTNVRLPPPSDPRPYMTEIATIAGISVKDKSGDRISAVSVGEEASIEGRITIEYGDYREDREMPYIFYVQIRGSGPAEPVEFIGSFQGLFSDANVLTRATVDWTPERSGLYIAETFVWSEDNVPLADRGPYTLIFVE